jgi:hypothetical protein
MFALSVRSLDGRCRRMPVGPGTTLAEVRAKLEESLPEFHQVKLFQGTKEVTDDVALEVEVQAVSTKSPDKALQKIEELASRIQCFLENGVHDGLEDAKNELMSLSDVLVEMETLDCAQSQKLCNIIVAFDNIICLFGDVTPTYAYLCSRYVVLALCRMAEAFGMVCGDPSAYLPSLKIILGNSFPILGVVAMLEIVARCGVESLSWHQQTGLAAWATHQLFSNQFLQNGGGFYDLVAYQYALKVCCALGKIMDNTCDLVHGFLQRFEVVNHETQFDDDERKLYEEVLEYATVFLQRLRTEQGDASEVELATQVPAGRGDGGAQVGMADPVAEPETETDPVMLFQQDLQEAIMRDKAEQAPICYDDSVVLFRLTRCSKEISQALSESPALVDPRSRVEDAGCSVFPDNAHGACLLVPLTDEQLLELSLQLKPHHVLALRTDKPAIVEALRMVPREERPKLRDDHRACPIEDERTHAEDLQEIAPAAGIDVFEEIELLHPYIRAKIRQFSAANEAMSESTSVSKVTESAPSGDTTCMQAAQKSKTNPRHWS